MTESTEKAFTEEEFAAFRQRVGDKVVKWKHMLHWFDEHVSKMVKVIKPMQGRLDALEKTVAELQRVNEKTLADAFRGTWQPGAFYTRGGLTVWDGSLWLCMADTGEKPGSTDAWRMITKRGKDAKA